MHTTYFVLKNRIYLNALLFLALLSPSRFYAQNDTTNTLESRQQIQDSVPIYIANSKRDSILPSVRLHLLLKALNYSKKIKEDTAKSKAFSKLSFAFYQHGDSIHFRQTNRTAIALAKKIKDSIILAEAYWDLGAFLQRIVVPDSAYLSYSQAQKIYESKGNLYLSGRMLVNMAQQQEAVKDYIGSEATIISAITRLKPLDKFRQLYFCYNQLGILDKDQSQYDKAIDHYNEALFYANKLDDNESYQIRVKNNLGVVYQRKKDFLSAIQNFEDVLSTDDVQLKNIELYSKAMNNLAFSKIKLKDTLGTKKLILESIKINDSLDLKITQASSYGTLAEYYLFEGDTITSISAASKSRTIAITSNDNQQLLVTLKLLTKIDVKNASLHALEHFKLNDSLQQEERLSRNKFAKIRFQTDEFIAENEVLSKAKQIWTAIAIGVFLLGLSFFVIISQRIKNQKLRFQQQQQSNNQEIFNLMLEQKQKVDAVKRMEQRRISEELHDGVLGKMLGARMVLTGLNKKADGESILERSEAIAALKNIENELRSISHELSHTAYRKINNFINSVTLLLGSTKEKTSINTVFNYDEDEDWDTLEGDIKINLYRIIQENLQNAIKHSDCSNFFVNFEMNDDFLLVTIGDDGKGFFFEKERKGIGIRNIKSRVKKMKGTWNIDTAPNNGTVMKLSIPANFSLISLDDKKSIV